MTQSPYFGQKDTSIPTSNPYVSVPPSSGYANNTVAVNQYYQTLNQSIPSNKAKYGVRRMLKWLAPERGIIEMYINPQNIQINETKTIDAKRTKGGFVVQYWGEELINIQISGHTGSSGIEGINVLRDIYRGEQIAFDIVALEEATKLKKEEDDFISLIMPGVGDALDLLKSFGEPAQDNVIEIPRPTLAYYATSIEMYWMGEIYRGFFKSFNVTENSSELGLFKYEINFMATQRRGYRRNYLPWQKTPLAGPSNHSDIPFTYDTKYGPQFNRRSVALTEAKALIK